MYWRLIPVCLVGLGLGGAALGQQAAPAGTGFVAGQVVDADTGAGLPESIVTLNSVAAPAGSPVAARAAALRVVTDGRGRFFFAGLAKGAYRLGVIKPGYRGGGAWQMAPHSLGETLELADGQRDARIDSPSRCLRAGT